MKKILFILFFTIPFVGFGQSEYIDFETEKIKFSYSNTYQVSPMEGTINSDIQVKLISKTIGIGGGEDNVGITTMNSKYSSLSSSKEIIKDKINDTELMFKLLGVNIQFKIISHELKEISGKRLLFIICQTELLDHDYFLSEMIYIYFKDKKTHFVNLTSSTLEELYKKEQDLNHIVTTLIFKEREEDSSKRYYDIDHINGLYGQLKEEGDYKETKPHGIWKYYYKSGQLSSQGNWKYGEVDGLWTYYYENGQLWWTTNYENGKIFDRKKYYESGELKEENIYTNGGIYRLCKGYYENGELESEQNYKDGERDGLYKRYYENGKLKEEVNYKDGERDGLSKSYYENGNLQIGCFVNKDDQLDGLWKSYYENGELQDEGTYKRENEFYSIRVGLWKEYYENGKLKSKGNFKNGQKDHLWEYYYENGKLEKEGKYISDTTSILLIVEDGLWKFYRESGLIQYEENYKNGEVIFKKFWDENGELITEDLFIDEEDGRLWLFDKDNGYHY